jgi:trimethylamine:corrinoid methyltransferase-like protein
LNHRKNLPVKLPLRRVRGEGWPGAVTTDHILPAFESLVEVHEPLIEIVGCGDTLDLMEILDNAPDRNFVTTDHTLRYCRDNIRSGLFVVDSMDNWQKKGGKDLYERAVERYKEIKKQLKPQALPEEVRREMDRIVKRADDHLVGKLGTV